MNIPNIPQQTMEEQQLPVNEEDEYKQLLKEKIRYEFYEEIDEQFHPFLEKVNLNDNREFIGQFALSANIPILTHSYRKKNREQYKLAILWNEIPKIAGVIGDTKKLSDKASDWKVDKWVGNESLKNKRTWENLSSGLESRTQLFIPEGYKGRITATSVFIDMDELPKLIVNLERNDYNVKILNQWLKALTLVSREFPRLAYETHMEINARQQQARILQLESPKEDQQKMYEMECRAREKVVDTLFSVKPDRLERSGYLYAYASESDIVQFKIKLGRTNKIKRRETEHNSSHAEDNKYLICVQIFDAELAERFLHRILQQCRYLHYNREFYRLTKERAIDVVKETKRLLDIAIETIYKPSIEDARKNYINGCMKINIEEEQESEDDEPPIEPGKIKQLLEEVEKLLGSNSYKLLTPDKFKKLIKDTIGREFDLIRRQLNKCNDFKYKTTDKRYKLMKK